MKTRSKTIKNFLRTASNILVATAFLMQSTMPVLAIEPTDAPVTDPVSDQTVVETPATELAAEGDPAAVNTNTGADSTNTSQTTVNNETNVTNENNAVTYNNAALTADTGHNSANYNTGSGIITTEKAKGQGGLLNVINVNTTNVQTQAPGPVNAGNTDTGADSANESIVDISNQLVVQNINNSNTINSISAQVSSGDNSAEHNTGHGIILTGDASLGLNFVTFANANLTGSNRLYADWQNVFDSYQGNIDLSAEAFAAGQSPLSNLIVNAQNSSTGSGSDNTAIVNVNDETTVINQNSGDIKNQISANVTSGKNKSNYNTGTGSVTTGKVNASVNALNFLNTNVTSSNWWLKTLNVFGDWKGNILLPQMSMSNLIAQSNLTAVTGNTETGSDSTNTTDVNITDSTIADNQNEAVITNNVMMKTSTGDNQTSYNNGSGAIKFGSSDAETNEINVANQNITGDSWWVVIVNKFGSWTGTTTGSPSDSAVSATENTTVISPQNSGINVANNSTGPQSNNIAGANINHSTSVENSNTAFIENNVELMAISGENEAQYNTGHGYIDTGDVRGSVNLLNFANTNITVGNWLAVVVNVFGNWEGNLVFNNAEAPGGSITPADFSQYAIEITPNEVTIPAGLSQTFSAVFKDPSGNTVNPQPEFTWSAGGGNIAPYTDPTQSSSSLGSAEAGNTETGSDSANSANTAVNNTTDVNNTNDASTTNNTAASSTTGSNSADYNTGSGIVATGQANVGADTTNNVNNNQTNVGATACAPTTDSANTGTGADSTNTAEISSDCSTDITNNNNSTVNNNFTGGANTGGNSANYNTGTGAVDTSWANTYVGAYNQQNENQITVGDVAQEFYPTGQNSIVFTAGDTPGTYTITVEVNGVQATATVTATAPASPAPILNPNPEPALTPNPTPTPTPESTPASAPSVNSGGGGGGGEGSAPIALLTSSKKYRADLNNDGKVDYYDFSILMANWGKKMKSKTADINSDSKVNDVDFSILMSDWAKSLAETKKTTKKA